MLTGEPFSIAEENFRDLVRPDTSVGNRPMIGQEDERAPDIEKSDHVVVIGDAAMIRRYELPRLRVTPSVPTPPTGCDR
jgi:hypothetical protein